jgi:hypothetical protein
MSDQSSSGAIGDASDQKQGDSDTNRCPLPLDSNANLKSLQSLNILDGDMLAVLIQDQVRVAIDLTLFPINCQFFFYFFFYLFLAVFSVILFVRVLQLFAWRLHISATSTPNSYTAFQLRSFRLPTLSTVSVDMQCATNLSLLIGAAIGPPL